MHEKDEQKDVQSEETSPLGCVHEGQENATGNRVAARDARGIRGVLDVHVPIRDDVQEVAHGDPKPYHVLDEVPHEGN